MAVSAHFHDRSKKVDGKLEKRLPGMKSWNYSLSMKGYFVVINGEDHITVALLLLRWNTAHATVCARFAEKSGPCLMPIEKCIRN